MINLVGAKCVIGWYIELWRKKGEFWGTVEDKKGVFQKINFWLNF